MMKGNKNKDIFSHKEIEKKEQEKKNERGKFVI